MDMKTPFGREQTMHDKDFGEIFLMQGLQVHSFNLISLWRPTPQFLQIILCIYLEGIFFYFLLLLPNATPPLNNLTHELLITKSFF